MEALFWLGVWRKAGQSEAFAAITDAEANPVETVFFSSKYLEAIDDELVEFIDAQGVQKFTMAMSDSAYGRRWIDQHLPKTSTVLSRRNFDVSTLRLLRGDPDVDPTTVGTLSECILNDIEYVRDVFVAQNM
jgi:oligoribonuclease (3'-5' exoribonuclease)